MRHEADFSPSDTSNQAFIQAERESRAGGFRQPTTCAAVDTAPGHFLPRKRLAATQIFIELRQIEYFRERMQLLQKVALSLSLFRPAYL